MSFVDVFTGDSVSPSELSYRAVALTASTSLDWPTLDADTANAVARIMDVTPSGAGFTLTMPDAREVSVGASVLFFNPGADSFSVLENDGSALVTVPAGQYRYIYLTDNTTQGGSWGVNAFGVGASSPDAAALAGFGIKAIGATLNQKQDTVESAVDVTIAASDRASLRVAIGGSVTYDLPLTTAVGNDFFVAIKNSGSGTVTVTPAGVEEIDEIDGGASLAMVPDESFILQSNGAGKWYTIGRGRPVTFAFSQLIKNVAPGGTTTLTSTEAANKIIQFVGVLTSDAEVEVPNVASIYWTFNNTTGAFTLTVKTAAGTGIAVQQGTRAMLLCDTVNVVDADDNPGTGVGFFPDGSEAAPGIAFSAEPTTGIRREGAGAICITGTQTDIHCFTAVAIAVNHLRSTNSATGDSVMLSAEGTDANISIVIQPKGTGSTITPGAGALSTAIGSGATAAGADAVAVGEGSTAAAAQTIAIGSDASATSAGSVAVGDGASAATGTTSIAIGGGSSATGGNNVVVGQGANATVSGAIAIGLNAGATGTDGVSIGDASDATGSNSVALGFNAQATAADAVAMGENTAASASQAIAIGSDAVVGAGATGGIAIGDGASVTAAATPNAVAVGPAASAGAARATAIGGAASATTNATAVGSSATASGIQAVAVGRSAVASATDNVAVGDTVSAATGGGQIAIGKVITGTGLRATTIGNTLTNAKVDTFLTGYTKVALFDGSFERALLLSDTGTFSSRDALVVVRRQIADNTAATELLTNAGTQLVIPANAIEGSVFFFDVDVVAQRVGTADLWSVVTVRDGVITRSAGNTTAITVAPTITELVDAADITVTVTADDASEALQVNVATGDSVGNEAVQVVAYVRLRSMTIGS